MKISTVEVLAVNELRQQLPDKVREIIKKNKLTFPNYHGNLMLSFRNGELKVIEMTFVDIE
jgi:predicted kinase